MRAAGLGLLSLLLVACSSDASRSRSDDAAAAAGAPLDAPPADAAPPDAEPEEAEPEEPELEEEDPRPAKGVTKDRAAGGTHWRFRAKAGVVHVWRPPGFQRDTAGTIVYLHGYRSSADQTWRAHGLARQFRACKQNALFIVPDTARGDGDGLRFPTLTGLLREVRRATRLPRPPGPIVVIGHSGAFRSIIPWLDYTAVDHVILLDALYGGGDKWAWWLEEAKGHASNKLTIVGQDTADEAEAFLRRFQRVERLRRIPRRWEDFDKRQRTARVLYVRSQYGHMQLVSSGKVISLLLRRTPLKPIE